jgi:prophage DNA circulation protein
MSYFSDRRPASFRGIAFDIESGDKAFGPHVVTHEFALRDDVAQEFQGEVPNDFAIEAVIVGGDFLARVKEFEAALSEKTPGRLVHPIYGELDVVVIGPARSRFNSNEGGIQRFSIIFQKAGAEPSPTVATDTTQAVSRAADATLQAALADFDKAFSLLDAPSYVGDDGAETIRSLAGEVQTKYRAAGLSDLVSAGIIASGLNDLLGVTADDLVNALAIGERLVGLFKVGGDTGTLSAGPSLVALASDTGIGAALPAPVLGTPARQQAASNQSTIVTLLRIAAVSEAARVGVAEGWESRDEAVAWRNDVSDAISSAADRTALEPSDTSWRPMIDLRAAIVADVATRAAPLPRLAVVTPRQTISSTLLAYQFDGDDLTGLFRRADDIVRRNGIRHPGFVAGDQPLEVLTDD